MTPMPDDELVALAHLLPEVAEVSVPADVRGRVLARATPPVRRSLIDPPTALRRAGDALLDELVRLPRPRWSSPTATWPSVAELVAHLTAMERLVRGRLTDPASTDRAHTATIDQGLATAAPDDLRAAFAAERARTDSVLAGADLEDRLVLHGMDMSVRTLCVARTFELWTHADDVRRVAGRSLVAPDRDQLIHMIDLAADLVAIDEPRRAGARTLRLVVTGPGGAVFHRSLVAGDPPGEPDLIVVADGTDLCRMVARRLAPHELEREVTGDDAVALAVLETMSLFALD